MERRGRIPVAKFRTQEGKTRSRSRVREPDYNEQDPGTDLFTLLEDNIALKEENKALKLEIDEHKKIQSELLEENVKLREEAVETTNLKAPSSDLTKLKNEEDPCNILLKGHREEKAACVHKPTSTALALDSTELQKKLLKLLPTLSNNEMESIFDLETAVASPLSSELIERLVDEFSALKNVMNSVELQLYEANEKISELLENQYHLEEDNEALRTENTNLTRVAKLLTENMKESVDTSKRMEVALVKLKKRNEELMSKQGDSTDGQSVQDGSPITIHDNNTKSLKIQKETPSQNLDHGERVVEMKTSMETAIQKNTNAELKKLQIKTEILEEELRQALLRAARAERKLQKYKNFNTSAKDSIPPSPSTSPPPQPPPPPPPPPPSTLLYRPTPLNYSKKTIEVALPECGGTAACTDNSFSQLNQLSGITGPNKILGSVMKQLQAEAATGVDALVREFKSGRVTLRRNRRKTRTNEALQEMFHVLEISQKQNRDSKICIDLHIRPT